MAENDILEAMFWNKFFIPSICVMLFVVGLHWVASIEGLYWTVDWFDVMMHFLGGLWTLLFILWVISTQYVSGLKKYVSISSLIIAVIVVGIIWEWHEIFFRFTSFSDPGYWFDTNKDLVMDTLGAIFGILVYKKDIKNKLQ